MYEQHNIIIPVCVNPSDLPPVTFSFPFSGHDIVRTPVFFSKKTSLFMSNQTHETDLESTTQYNTRHTTPQAGKRIPTLHI